jgi:D-alanyl-D-alanine dipeptidase
MGAEYDDFREIAFPKLEAQFLKSGELSKQQVDNRKLLRKVMSSQQFRNIPTEWWHFNAFSRITTSHKYQMLETESGKTKWFRILPKKDTTALDEFEE